MASTILLLPPLLSLLPDPPLSPGLPPPGEGEGGVGPPPDEDGGVGPGGGFGGLTLRLWLVFWSSRRNAINSRSISRFVRSR